MDKLSSECQIHVSLASNVRSQDKDYGDMNKDELDDLEDDIDEDDEQAFEMYR